MRHSDDPRSLIPVNLGQILLEPVELLVRFVVGVVAFDVAEGPAVGDVGVLFLWLVGLAVGFGDEGIFWAVC